jgi:molybdate transport system substrate-binding protein
MCPLGSLKYRASAIPLAPGHFAGGYPLSLLGTPVWLLKPNYVVCANPEHAPHGKRAEEALRHADLWDRIKEHLVLGENVSHAAELATTGGAQGGIIAYSLALSPSVSKLSRFALIPDTWHEPLKQRMVLIKGADETTQAFYRYLQQPAARDILRRYGLALPSEQ